MIVFGATGVGLHRVPGSGGASTVLTSVAGRSNQAFPSFLPDGQHFLYRADQEVRIGSLATDPPKTVLNGTSQVQYAPGYLLYVRETTLMAQAFDAGRLETTGDAYPVAEDILTGTSGNSAFSVSANGVLVYQIGAVNSGVADGQLTWFERAGKLLGTVDKPGQYTSVALSPWHVVRGRASRSPLTIASIRSGHATGSGSRLRTGRRRPIGCSGLRPTVAVGSRRLSTLGTRRYPTSWSPDGTTLAFYMGGASSSGPTTQAPNRDIWMLRMNGDTRTATAFIAGPFEERGGIFSPSGRWVAYVSNKSGQNDVFARPYPGPGGEVTISVGGGQEPVWGPSGKELFYRHAGKLLSVRIAEEVGELKVGSPVALFDDTFRPDTGGAQGGMANYDIAPDGQHFVVVEEQRQNDPAGARLQVVLNWFEELKARVPTK